ncbi:hypothetical protein BT69DRAFT_1346389 [Atractiella rhizophila]|nr:hypothetical protein BT69DRAFT_1346389 [Atractiella rhizophila]
MSREFDASTCTRVDSKLLHSLPMNRLVRAVGKVLKIEDRTLTLESVDLGQIVVNLVVTDPETITATYVEVTGRIKEDYVLNELTLMNLGEWMSYDMQKTMIKLQQQFPDMFDPNP